MLMLLGAYHPAPKSAFKELKVTDEREMNLDEWCGYLPAIHSVRRELRAMRDRERHPFRLLWPHVKFQVRDYWRARWRWQWRWSNF